MLLRANARSRAALKASASFGWLKASGVGVLLTVPLLAAPAFANPAGGNVTSGAASISNASANATKVQQSSEDVVIDWSSFNVGAGQSTTFVQPNAQAIAVNRIGGKNASQIMGTLDANGRVVLINGNGMLFGKNAQVNVGALIATSTGGSDSDVLAGRFTTAGNQNSTVANRGTITASPGGLVALVAPHVTNSGTVNAKFGTVALGAGNKFTVDFTGDGLVSFATQGDVAGNARVANSGLLTGANVSLTARAAEGLATGVVSMTGTIVAQNAYQRGGTIVLDGGAGGNVNVSHATLDASGAQGGGGIQVGGWNENAVSVDKASILNASATRSGNGGTIAVISSATRFAGQALAQGGSQSGNGGTIETSGYNLDFIGANVDAASVHGVAGSWTLDPDDLVADASAADAIHRSLQHDTDVLLQTTADGTTGPGNVVAGGVGDIFINSAIDWSTDATLTIDAYHSININADIHARGAGTLNLDYDDEETNGSLDFTPLGHVDFVSETDTPTLGSLNINGTPYTLVADVAALASDIALNPAGDFALAADYNATVDGTYASSPISTSFTGTFEGLGNTISNLTITNAVNTDVGLFSELGTGGTVRDLNLRNIDVSATSDAGEVGALAATNYGAIDNVTVTGSVAAGFEQSVGGLVGIDESGASITNSGATDSVTAGYYSYTGGLAGQDGGSIVGSYAKGNVVADYASDIGGLVGLETGTVTSSYAKGTVNAAYSSQAGGLVGFGSGSTITSSYATGNTTAGYESNVAGLLGWNTGTISTDFATGSVTGGYSSNLGGLVGQNGGAITNAYARGSETSTGSSHLGGLVGYNSGNVSFAYSIGTQTDVGGTNGGLFGDDYSSAGSITDTYWVMVPKGNTNPADGAGSEANDPGITGLTMKQMIAGLPAGFDPTVWAESGATYKGLPYLLALQPG
jgi:filamentous hemagglutinin family protein